MLKIFNSGKALLLLIVFCTFCMLFTHIINKTPTFSYIAFGLKNTSKKSPIRASPAVVIFLLLLKSGDVKINPGLHVVFKYLTGIFTHNSKNLKFFHVNVQSFVKKRLDLNFIVDDLRENTIYRSSETWSTENDDQKLWEMHPNSFKTFRSDRETPNKNCGGGLLLRIPKYLNPKVRKDLNLMNKNYFECLWVECNINCQNSTRQRQMINICYNPNKNVSIFFGGSVVEYR